MKALSWLRRLPEDHPYILQELDEIRAQNAISRQPAGGRNGYKYAIRRVLSKGTRNRIGIGLLLMICQNATGGISDEFRNFILSSADLFTVNIITYYRYS